MDKFQKCQKKCGYIIIFILMFNLHLCNNTYSKDSFFAEMCYLEDNYVLLYKIINWWNDSAPDDDHIICGNHLRCELMGKSKLRYNNNDSSLLIESTYHIEELISFIQECKEGGGPTYFVCSYLNQKYFGTTPIQDILPIYSSINSIVLAGIIKKQALHLIEREQKIGLEVGGRIAGLLLNNGKIATHHGGNFLKSCPQPHQNRNNFAPAFLIIKNLDNDEILAKYTVVGTKSE